MDALGNEQEWDPIKIVANSNRMEILFLKIMLSVFLVKIANFGYVIQYKLPQFSQNPRNFDWNSGFIYYISRTVYFNDWVKGKKK